MAKVKYYAKENSSIGTHSYYAARSPTVRSRLTFELTRQTGLIRRLLPQHLARRTSPRDALAKVATRAAVRLAGNWRDVLRDVRCKM